MRPRFLFAALSTFLIGISFAAQTLTTDEQTFIQKAAAGDQAEIKLSQLALERATSSEIKQFAQTMVTDHTKSSSLLKPIALDHGVVLPENPAPQAEEKFKRLEGQSGAAFDKELLLRPSASPPEVSDVGTGATGKPGTTEASLAAAGAAVPGASF